MAFDVDRQLDDLATAQTDNVQWSLTQAEVEFLQLESAAQQAAIRWTDYAGLRRRFDILYSRVSTLEESLAYATLRDDPEFREPLTAVRRFLDAAVPVIDGPDRALRAALPDLIADIDGLHPQVRALSLHGVEVFADRADARRAAVSDTLGRVAALTVIVVTLLAISVAALMRASMATRRRAAELAVASSRLAAVVNTSLDAVVVVDRTGRILEFNPAATEIFGYRRDEVLGQEMSRVIVPPHLRAAHRAGMERHLATGERRVLDAGRVELDALRRDGTVFPVEVALSRARSLGREVFVAFLRDISARRAAEEALLKARDDALAGEKSKADFLAVMSHEMRTPLNGLLGTLDLMRGSAVSREDAEHLRLMELSGRQLLSHVNDVLDISRLDADGAQIEPRPFDLSRLVRDLVGTQGATAAASGNEIVLSGFAAPDWMLGDEARVSQLLYNLVGNALKFTRDGVVQIEAERLQGGEMVELRIADTGVGIAPEHRARVFEDFVTLDTTYNRSAGGTGLGLGIVRRIVRAAGGEVELESEPGEGTIVLLRLPMPAVAPPAAQRAAPPAAGAERVHARDVLVVEDNPVNRAVLRGMLERAGHRVAEAVDGEAGVRMAAARRYDIVLMDISMPGIDGVEATQRIRAGEGLSREVPIVATTAHAMPAERARFLQAGLTDVLLKPVSRAAVAEVLARAMAGGGAAPPPPQVAPPVQAAQAAGDAPLFDAGVLGALVHALGSEAVGEILSAFKAQGDALVDRLDGGSPRDAGLVAEVHKLAGSAGVLGATALAAELGRIELLIKTGQTAPLIRRLEALPGLWAATRADLDS